MTAASEREQVIELLAQPDLVVEPLTLDFARPFSVIADVTESDLDADASNNQFVARREAGESKGPVFDDLMAAVIMRRSNQYDERMQPVPVVVDTLYTSEQAGITDLNLLLTGIGLSGNQSLQYATHRRGLPVSVLSKELMKEAAVSAVEYDAPQVGLSATIGAFGVFRYAGDKRTMEYMMREEILRKLETSVQWAATNLAMNKDLREELAEQLGMDIWHLITRIDSLGTSSGRGSLSRLIALSHFAAMLPSEERVTEKLLVRGFEVERPLPRKSND